LENRPCFIPDRQTKLKVLVERKRGGPMRGQKKKKVAPNKSKWGAGEDYVKDRGQRGGRGGGFWWLVRDLLGKNAEAKNTREAVTELLPKE